MKNQTSKTMFSGRMMIFLLLSALGVSHAFDFVHHDQEAMLKVLADTHEKCGQITRLYDLSPKSVEGRVLRVIVFGKDPDQHVVGVPEFK